MTQSPTHPVSNPYVGPRTFTYAQRRFFFGREREARDLLARVVSERVLLFYAQSGAGKSSLLQTRLIPQLREEEGFAVLPVGRVSGALPTGLGEVANLYLFNLMASLDQSNRNPQRLTQLSLSRFLAQLTSEDGEHWHYVEAPTGAQSGAETATPTGGARPKVDEAVAIAPAAPATTNGAVHPAELAQRYALIIDQFEEIITTHPNRWREREEFFRQVNQALLDDRNLWVVLTLREDYVAALDPYAQFMTDKLRARFYMERMGVAAALEAVRQPAALAGRPFAAGVAEALVDNLRRIKVTGQAEQLGQYVEPVQLQVVCYQLWEKVTAAGAPSAAIPAAITMTDLQQSGDVNTALGDFYNGAVATVLKEVGPTLAERRLRTWVNTQLITEAGTRGTVYQGLADTAGLPNPIVKRLTDQFLLRAEQRAGGYWVELVHDRFVEPIREANARWQAQYYNPIAAAYQRWQTSGQADHLLLQEESLREAQRFAESATVDLTEDEREFLQRSASEEKRRTESQVQQQQNQRRNRLIVAATVAATVLAILVAIIGYIALQAREARSDAEKARADAVAARIVAEVERQRADEERARAEEERQSALIQAGNAAIARAKQLAAQAQAVYVAEERLLLAVEAVNATTALSTTHQVLQVAVANQSLQQALQNVNGFPRLAHNAAVYDVAFSPDNRWVASASEDQLVRLWSRAQPADPPLLLQGHTGTVYDLAFHPNGKILASAGADRTVRLWSVAAPTLPAVVLQGHTAGIARVTFSPDGQWLASASTDQTVRLWRVADPTAPAVVLRGHTDRLYDAVFSPDSQLLATASQDKTVRVWPVNAPQVAPFVLAAHTDGVAALAFSPDGTLLASASLDKSVRLWQVADFTSPAMLLTGHEEAVRTLEFSPDQRWLATAGNDQVVNVWSLADLQSAPLALRGMNGEVYDVSFSPDSAWLSAGGQNGNLRLWRLADKQSDPIIIGGQYDHILSVSFSDDSQWLASASFDSSVQLWPLASDRMVALACQRAGRNFNNVEWTRYFGDDAYQRTCPQWPIHASIAEAAYQRGKTLAVAGQFAAAIAQFEQVLALDPTRTLDPTAEADRLQKAAQAAQLVETGRKLAESGDVTSAVAQFTEAVALDPTLSLNPATEATAIYTAVQRAQAQQVLAEAQTLAKNLDLPGATEKFAEVVALDPTLALEPATEAGRLAAQTLIARGRATAQRGDRAAALADYEAAQRYDPTLTLTPQLDVQLAYARGLADRWAPAQAMAALAAAQALSPTLDLSSRVAAYEWDQLCRRGALSNMAAVVMPACEAAVAQAPTIGDFRASRGFARALQNDSEGAIADFQFTIDAARQAAQQGSPQQSAPQQTVSPSVINGYKAWITALRAGVNPIQAYVLTRNGAVDQALPIYRAFHAISPPLQLTAAEWNNLCWYGTLAQRAEQVLYACEWAVTLEPENGNYRDSRGLARALLGDLTGAIEDFEAYLAQSGTTISNATRNRRQGWIQAFRAGMNPAIAERLTRNGPIDMAIALYAAFDSIQPPLQLTAEEWNNLCWYGSLALRAQRVLFACDRAVAQEPTNGNFHDSRSLARVMTGDFTGALEDLAFTVEWAHESQIDQSFIVDRRFWLFVLKIAQPWEVKQ